ncbi:hypothetical protein [Paremcibacter congregatus]|uniref:Uncharacterized protein n=1 Tax=Paremcibacter congregatus TaxID=2043170 RepID=A0A2G4YTV8_9PROT|nr:hypothetical protein [Paremcibacter congregatus]PHZ85707.1 hypothetical protein CRD36_03200 [Paremcibacter congregatus]QDE26669.1 hypothetical protein FIV45_04960 [Paremcibacter congregatus]|tara:strand:- start:8387 stop:8725 length:339 start_codon:yes stop_codon:yes gene_type:complete
MSSPETKTDVSAIRQEIEDAILRLERALLSRSEKTGVSSDEQAGYIAELEEQNKKLMRELDETKKHCITLKKGYELLEAKYRRLEEANDSAEKELATTLQDLDALIAQKSLH